MSSFALKILGILTMCIDHLGFMFFQDEISYRLIGRLAMPIFAFQLAVGFSHSKNKEKHILRILIFAIISQVPFSIFRFFATSETSLLLNIGFTFVFGLLGMYVWDKAKNIFFKFTGVLGVFILSHIIPVDYGLFGTALCVVFYICRSSKLKTILGSTFIICCKLLTEKLAWRIPTLYALIPISFYNGKKGLDTKFTKNLFYIFYPLHMIIFAIIYQAIQ